MNETTARFLKGIVERLGLERIVEVHLFPPMRQGQMETGVAVVAATPRAEVDGSASDAQPSPPPADSPPSAIGSRLEVLSAWYQLTRKGPDRGKWEVDVQVEADAPLTTVGAVVRGVQQRLGETIEPERFSAERLEAVLNAPAWSDAARDEPGRSESAWRSQRP